MYLQHRRKLQAGRDEDLLWVSWQRQVVLENLAIELESSRSGAGWYEDKDKRHKRTVHPTRRKLHGSIFPAIASNGVPTRTHN